MKNIITINGKTFEQKSLLGHGKGGYSYLVSDGQCNYVAKCIHHEPCAYYNFGDKLAAELNDYKRLCAIGIPVPRLIDVNVEREIILKEYVEGSTVFELVKSDCLTDEYWIAIRQIASICMQNGLNIDYFPTNFIMQNHTLYYVDYECNSYMAEWSFENWGKKYWSKTPEFLSYLDENKG